MKKFFVLLLVVMLVFAGCASGTTDSGDNGENGEEATGDVKIGYVTTNMNDTFQTYIVDAATALAEELDMPSMYRMREDVGQKDQVMP